MSSTVTCDSCGITVPDRDTSWVRISRARDKSQPRDRFDLLGTFEDHQDACSPRCARDLIPQVCINSPESAVTGQHA